LEAEAEKLHHNAMLALAGTLPAAAGEEAIAALLRSSIEIDPIVRGWLADAVAPTGKRPSNVRLRLTNLEEGRFARELHTKTKMLERGKIALRAIENGLSWEAAVTAAAGECSCSPQSIEKGVTYAKRYEEWCGRFIGNKTESDVNYHAWRISFHVAAVQGRDPGEYWTQQMSALGATAARQST
jgi:hypothetical protein